MTMRRFSEFYSLGEPLGQGSFSVVKTAYNLKTGAKVAVKIVNRLKLHPKDIDAFLHEVAILRTLDHPNIVKMLDFFEEPNLYYLVLEYVGGGELFDRLVEKASYTEGEARDLAIIMFHALKYIHDKGLVHRDIKPENILLVSRDDDVSLKLADFGFCVDSSTVQSGPSKQTVGTPGYVSPEMIERKPHGPPVDMWAMGVILYMLLGGYPPFYEPDDDQKTIYARILRAAYEFHPENWSQISSEAKDLISKLLVVDPSQRYTVDQALAHPWLSKPRESLALVSLNNSLISLRDWRTNRAKQAQALASVAIDAMRKLSGANLSGRGSISINDVAVDVMRKISGTNLNEAVIEAARKRSGMNLKLAGERIEANRSRSNVSLGNSKERATNAERSGR